MLFINIHPLYIIFSSDLLKLINYKEHGYIKKTLYFRSVSGKTEEGETEESLHVSSQTNAYHKK